MTIRKAWPLHDNVQDGPRAFGRFMAGPREVDIDDPYWVARIGDGSISFTDPNPEPTPFRDIGGATRPVFVNDDKVTP